MTKHTKPEHKRKTESINTPMTKLLKEKADKKAKTLEIPLSKYVRNLIKKDVSE